ncbi:hypothetical protein C8Q77DRAFT_583946 [Trametes polyzona]|nr:hypothetical protein C8Q77DRAFT_583946 [Trametes polyzona]
MRFFISAATIIALTPVVLGQGPKINTLTSPTQCEPVQFTWEGGAPPYYLSLIPGGQPSAQAIKQFPVQNGNSMTWTVDLPAGTSFSSSLRDSTGAQAFSDIQTVQAGPDSSCLNGSSSGATSMDMTSAAPSTPSASASSAASVNSATTVSSPAAAQKAISTTSSGTATISETGAHAASSVASTTSATATSSNAASLHNSAGAIGIAGLLGLVGAALLG